MHVNKMMPAVSQPACPLDLQSSVLFFKPLSKYCLASLRATEVVPRLEEPRLSVAGFLSRWHRAGAMDLEVSPSRARGSFGTVAVTPGS